MMNKRKVFLKMGLWVIGSVLALATVSFIIWYTYTTSSYEIDVEFIAKIETDKIFNKTSWDCKSVEYTIKHFSEGGVYKAIQNSNTEAAIEKIKNVDSEKYNILIINGSDINKVTKTRDRYDYVPRMDYKNETPESIMYLYKIDADITAIPLY